MQALRHFVTEVGKAAEYPRTGKPLGAAAMAKLHAADVAREERLVTARLRNIELRNKCARLT